MQLLGNDQQSFRLLVWEVLKLKGVGRMKEEVQKTLKKMKSGKAPGVDEIACEMLKAGGATVIDWFNGKCMYE